jgi:hypothetical protein
MIDEGRSVNPEDTMLAQALEEVSFFQASLSVLT